MPSTHHGILLHFVFSTKNRVPLIDEHWQDELFAYMGATAREHKATVLCSGGIEDHVHLLAKVHPSYAIADTVQLIKANASRWINLEHRTNSRFEWQRGYGAFVLHREREPLVAQVTCAQNRSRFAPTIPMPIQPDGFPSLDPRLSLEPFGFGERPSGFEWIRLASCRVVASLAVPNHRRTL